MNDGDLYFKKLKVSDDTARGYVYDSMVCKGRVETMIESSRKGAAAESAEGAVQERN